MILDFSTDKFSFNESPLEEWQQEILAFLQLWNNDLLTLTVLTSGSTGVPKEIEVLKNSMQQSALNTGLFFNLKKGDTALLCLPVNYVAGKMMLVRAIVLQLKLVCVKPSQSINSNQKIDFAALTPMQINQSIDSIFNFKKVIIGGSKLEESTKEKLLKIKTTIFFETYGMTETVSHIAIKNISKQENYFRLLPNISMQYDERKCLVLSVPYISDKQIFTNDLVEIIDATKFKFLGRIDNVINSGGIKILPEIVEEKLKPYIPFNFVISSKQDDLLGEKLVLIIEGVENKKLVNKLALVFKNELTKYQIPKDIIFIKNIPKTINGKIMRKELKK